MTGESVNIKQLNISLYLFYNENYKNYDIQTFTSNLKNFMVFYIYKSGGIKYVSYDGITNDHLVILNNVGGCILGDADIIDKFSTVPKFRDPYRYSLE